LIKINNIYRIDKRKIDETIKNRTKE